MDTPGGERADIELTRLIEKRYVPDDGAMLLEPGYSESVRKFNARQQEENRRRWRAFHEGMCRLHSQLADEHAQKAEKLCEKGDT